MKWFRNLKISKKLAIGFGTVLITMVILGVVSLSQMSKLNGSTNDIATNWLPSVRALGDINSDAANLRNVELAHILVADKNAMDKAETEGEELLHRLQKDEKAYESMISSDEEWHIYDTFRGNFDKYMTLRKQVFDLSRQNKKSEA